MEDVSSVTASSAVNLVLFQVGWLSAVLSAAHGRPWAGVAVVAIVLGVHLRFFARHHEGKLIVVSALLGVIVDSGLKLTGLVDYQSPTPPAALAPAWIVAMWANLAITLEHSMAWVGRARALPFVAGAVAGPLAYRGAEALGAVRLERSLTLAVLALVWGLSLAVLVRLSVRFRPPSG